MKYFGEIVNDKDLVTKEYVDRYAQLSGASFTGPVTFGNSVSIDEATIGDLVINGNASFTNNIQANTINGVEVGSTPKFTDTDTKVTSSANHYTPATASGNDKTASASGATAAWNIDVVKGITINTDGKGHITGLSVTSGKIPANPNTDVKVKQLAAITTAGAYPIILAYSTATTEETNSVNKTSTLTYNPNTKALVTGGTVDGYTLAAASAKSVVTSIDTSASLPTSNAVKTFVENKGYTTNTGTITQVKTTAGAHTTINVSSGAATFNVPTKTSHLTNDSGFITNSTLYESRLNWGNINLTGNVTPVGMSLSAEHSANRIAYLNPNAIQIEYTTNGGSTWLDSGYTNEEKTWLCTSNQGIAIGQSKSGYSSTTALTTNHWTRITLTGQDGTNTYVYTAPRKLLINMSTALGVECLIEYKTGVSNASWQTFGTYTVAGWSGWNDIPLILGTFGGGTSQTGNNWYLRFTFKVTSTRTDNYKGYAQVYGLRLFGAGDWTSASSANSKGPFSSTGHLYSYDVGANATFPAKVTATSFSGPLTGNVTGNVSGTAANVTGTVAIANGGTGQTTAANAINALLNGLPTWTADPTDSTYFIRQDTGGSATYGKVKASTIWNYISGKLPAWSKASTKPSYNFSEIGLTPTTLNGYGITDAKIASGTITLGSNTITPLTSSSTLNAAKLSGAIPSAVTATTQTAGDNSTKIATTAFVSSAISTLGSVLNYKGTKATISALPTSGNTTGDVWHVTANSGEYVWDGTEWQELGTAISIPANTGNSTTGISIAAHGTGTVIGVQSTTTSVRGVKTGNNSLATASHVKSGGNGTAPTLGTAISLIGVQSSTTSVRGVKTGTNSTTTASKVTLGTAFSIPNPSATDVTVPIRADADVTVPVAASAATTVPIKATSATTVPIRNISATAIPNVTAVGSGDASLTFAMDTTDTKKLKITFSHTHIPPTLGTAISLFGVQANTTSVIGVQSSTTSVTGVSGSTTVRGVKTGTNSTTTASKVSFGTAFSVPNVTGATDITVPIRADADTTVPIKNVSATSIPNVTSAGTASTWTFEDVNVPIRADADTTVPIKNASASTFVTGTTHTVTDNGHTHTI